MNLKLQRANIISFLKPSDMLDLLCKSSEELNRHKKKMLCESHVCYNVKKTGIGESH